MAIPTRSPVNGPGPQPTTTASSCSIATDESARAARTLGVSRSAWARGSTVTRSASTSIRSPSAHHACGDRGRGGVDRQDQTCHRRAPSPRRGAHLGVGGALAAGRRGGDRRAVRPDPRPTPRRRRRRRDRCRGPANPARRAGRPRRGRAAGTRRRAPSRAHRSRRAGCTRANTKVGDVTGPSTSMRLRDALGQHGLSGTERAGQHHDVTGPQPGAQPLPSAIMSSAVASTACPSSTCGRLAPGGRTRSRNRRVERLSLTGVARSTSRTSASSIIGLFQLDEVTGAADHSSSALRQRLGHLLGIFRQRQQVRGHRRRSAWAPSRAPAGRRSRRVRRARAGSRPLWYGVSWIICSEYRATTLGLTPRPRRMRRAGSGDSTERTAPRPRCTRLGA